jgi:uncharacterized protein DUF4837
MTRTAPRILAALLALSGAACGGRPFAEGGSRDLTIATSLPPDAPEILLLRAVLERPAIRIEDETAYAVRVASARDARVYRARNLLFVGHGPRASIPEPLTPLARLRDRLRAPFVFTQDLWLRGQAAGLVWTDSADSLLPLLQREQNRIFLELDRATFATVRARMNALPRDAEAERRIQRLLGFRLRVPRGYEARIDPGTGALLLLDEGPPARLLRLVAERSSSRAADLARVRSALARTFRPQERTLQGPDPVLTGGEMPGARRQIHGRWEDAQVSAAGPYRFYEITREGRRYYVDLAVFAPGRPKLPYLRELQAIAETLTSR